MSTVRSTAEGLKNEADGTLGQLLYADPTKDRVAEGDWVALVLAIAAQDQRALHALYERSHRLVFTLALRLTCNRETAEEVTVDVFHDIWRRASGYDPATATVLAWVMNQARSRAIDRIRFDNRKKRVDPNPSDPTNASITIDSGPALELAEQQRALREALTLLTVDERAAIETAYFSELSYSEVAARLRQPLGTIKTRIRSGLAKLRQALAKGARP